MSDATIESKEKPIKDLSDFPLKHQALKILTDNGLTTAEASKVLEYKGKSGYVAKTKLNKYMLSNRKLGSLAFKAVKETLKMKPVITEERKICPECKNDMEKVLGCTVCKGEGYVFRVLYPSTGDRLKAADMYYQRIDPVNAPDPEGSNKQSFTNFTVNNYIVNNADNQGDNCKDITPNKCKDIEVSNESK